MIQKPQSGSPFVDKFGVIAKGWAQWVENISRIASKVITTDSVHNDIGGRDAVDCHPINAITDLSATINTLEATDQANATATATAQATASTALTTANQANNKANDALAIGNSNSGQISSLGDSLYALGVEVDSKIETVSVDGTTIVGDGTVSSPLAVGAISLPQIQGISSGVLLGRSSLLVGEAQEITLGHGLGMGEGIISVNDTEIVIDMSQVNGLVDDLSDKVSKSDAGLQTMQGQLRFDGGAWNRRVLIENGGGSETVGAQYGDQVAQIQANSSVASVSVNKTDYAVSMDAEAIHKFVSGTEVATALWSNDATLASNLADKISKSTATAQTITSDISIVGLLTAKGVARLTNVPGYTAIAMFNHKDATGFGFFADASGNNGIAGAVLDLNHSGNTRILKSSVSQMEFNGASILANVPIALATYTELLSDLAGRVRIRPVGGVSYLELFSSANDVRLMAYDRAGASYQGASIRAKSISLNTNGTSRVDVTDSSTKINIPLVLTQKTPASASASGIAGEICADANYIYHCVATNTWKRVAIATW